MRNTSSDRATSSFSFMPDYVLRGCRTPDCKRTVGAWMLYMDVNALYPFEKGWKIPETPVPPPYEIRPVESKGRGMITTREIKRGELIVCERPVLMAPRMVYGNTRNRWATLDAELPQLLSVLEKEDRERVLQLHNCKPLSECSALTGILRTNALGASFPESQICTEYAAVCLNMSYVNHSCAFNATYTFNLKELAFSLHATRDITVGEEIAMSYIEEGMTRVERQASLQRDYNFTCACAFCSAPAADIVASDGRRRFIRDTLKAIESNAMWDRWLKCPPRVRSSRTKLDVDAIEGLLRAMDEEGLQGGHEGRLIALQHCAFVYAALCDAENFKKWAERCLAEVKDKKEDGDAEHAPNWESWLENPSMCPMWNLCTLTATES